MSYPMSGEEGNTGTRREAGDGDRRTRKPPGLIKADSGTNLPFTILGAYCLWVHRFATIECSMLCLPCIE